MIDINNLSKSRLKLKQLIFVQALSVIYFIDHTKNNPYIKSATFMGISSICVL